MSISKYTLSKERSKKKKKKKKKKKMQTNIAKGPQY